jgi:myo-inositol-1(or 4)-monophosphatase
VTTAQLLEIAQEAASAAGEVLVERFGHARGVSTKSTPTDLVSEADLAGERAIRDVLAARVPDDAIVGEEGEDVAGTTGRSWVVDPLDGTINYLFGIPQWCVSVACQGEAGVIYDPLRQEVFAATADGPATLNGEPLTPSARTDLSTALVATGFGYDAQRRVAQAQVAARVIPAVRDIRRLGSAALDLAWTAAGRYDAYWEFGVQEWDIAAGELICSRAGLHVQRLEPSGVLPWGSLVAAPALAPGLLELVA